MDIIQGPVIRRVPDVHPPRPVQALAVIMVRVATMVHVAVMAVVQSMVRVAVMAVVQTLGRAVCRLRHVHVLLKLRHVIHLVPA